jgi:stage V sporulation protein S
MDRILRGLRGGQDAASDTGDATDQEDAAMQTAPAHTRPVSDTGAETSAMDTARRSDILKVSARSRPSAVAGAIAGVVRESGRAEVQAIGAGAANQAIKAVAIAREYLAETGITAVCLPSFIDVVIDEEDRTALRLIVEPR